MTHLSVLSTGRVIILLAVALVSAFWAAGPAQAQIVLDGRYLGLGEAAGSELRIAPDPGGFTGRFTPRGGPAQAFEADRTGDQADAVVRIDGQAHLMQVTPLPYGAEVALIPFAADGTLVFDGAALYTYLREGVEVPQAPEGFREPPRDARSQYAANSFLVSYEFWRPTGVRDGYLSLAPRARTLIRLFPAVQLDIIWKLCLAPKADDALAIALRGQGVDCEGVIAGLARAQAEGQFAAYKRDVAAAKDTLLTSIRCGENYPMDARGLHRGGRAPRQGRARPRDGGDGVAPPAVEARRLTPPPGSQRGSGSSAPSSRNPEPPG